MKFVILAFAVLVGFACSRIGDQTALSPIQTSPSPVPTISADTKSLVEPVIGRFSPALSIGDVHLDASCVFLFIQNSGLQAGDEVQIISTEEPQKVVRAKVSVRKDCEEENTSKTPWPEPSGFDPQKPPPMMYILDLETNDQSHPQGYAIGVLQALSPITMKNDRLAGGDLDGDGQLEYFRECSSREGLHMTVWKGKPLIGKRIWHSYTSLGYDTERTCKRADYR